MPLLTSMLSLQPCQLRLSETTMLLALSQTSRRSSCSMERPPTRTLLIPQCHQQESPLSLSSLTLASMSGSMETEEHSTTERPQMALPLMMPTIGTGVTRTWPSRISQPPLSMSSVSLERQSSPTLDTLWEVPRCSTLWEWQLRKARMT